MNILELKKVKFCPICRKKWTIIDEQGKQGKAYFCCFKCMISVWVRDPFVGKWDKIASEDPVHCPTCRNHQMRFFCRSDGYMMYKCLNCKTVVETYDKLKHGEHDDRKSIIA